MTSANLNYHFSWTMNICIKIWANPGIFLFNFVLFTSQLLIEKSINMDSGCCSDGRVVVSNTRDPRFESGHRQILSTQNICKPIINSIEKTKKKRKRGKEKREKHRCRVLGLEPGTANWLAHTNPLSYIGYHFDQLVPLRSFTKIFQSRIQWLSMHQIYSTLQYLAAV